MSSSAAQIGELQPPGEKRDEEHFSFNYVHFALEKQRKLGTTQNEHVLTKWEHFVLNGGGIIFKNISKLQKTKPKMSSIFSSIFRNSNS